MSWRKTSLYKTVPAYSLLEVGVVLLIVGIMIGGVLKGTDLLDAARTNTLAQQYQDFRLATYAFMDKYGAVPGDFSQATLRISPDLLDGNGDSQLDGHGLSSGSEAHSFWAHLKGAGLLEGLALQDGVPSAKIGGLWSIEQNPFQGIEGLWFIVGKPYGSRAIGGGVTPEQAQALLAKLDDGNPTTGRLRAIDGADQSVGSCVMPGGTLNLNTNKPVCVLLFKVS